MNVELRAPSQLSPQHREAWQALRASETGLDDAFFAVEFFEVLESVRGGVEIAVMNVDGRPVGFLPLERRGASARPAGHRVSEIHGPIARGDLEWNPPELFGSLGISVWQYGCVPACQAALVPYHLRERRFPGIDLRQGFSHFIGERRAAGSRQIDQTRRKARKLERECGTLRFEWHTEQQAVMDRLLEWKSGQYRRTGTLDLLRFEWIVELLQRVRRRASDDFAGVLSALYCGDAPVAVHLGLRSQNVFCWWLPAYDPRLARYSPGAILTLRVIEAAAEQGVSRIDLGQGDERYKQSLANSAFAVAEGVIDPYAWNRAMRRGWIRVRDWAQSTPFCATPLRVFRSVRNRLIHS